MEDGFERSKTGEKKSNWWSLVVMKSGDDSSYEELTFHSVAKDGNKRRDLGNIWNKQKCQYSMINNRWRNKLYYVFSSRQHGPEEAGPEIQLCDVIGE